MVEEETGTPAICSNQTISTMQMNIGLVCNLSCKHCHVEAGSLRTETMPLQIMEQGLGFMGKHGIHTLDITGGAPELNPHFLWLVQQASSMAYA
jgi:MoaA/NifB/PqqE/SkfB family radical SAM enzyme